MGDRSTLVSPADKAAHENRFKLETPKLTFELYSLSQSSPSAVLQNIELRRGIVLQYPNHNHYKYR